MRPAPEPLFTVAEIADAWRLSRESIYALIRSGELPAKTVGHGRAKTRVRESVLLAYIDSLPEVEQATRPRKIRHLAVAA